MWRKKYMFDLDGEILQILPNESAEIEFILNGKIEKALLKKKVFYHNGRLIPENEPLSKYIRNSMQVTFSCHILEGSVQYTWFTIMCRAKHESPLTQTTITTGLCALAGSIEKITKRHGVISITNEAGDEHRVAFLASKVYLYGKRFPSSKMLNTELCVEERLIFDAVPCIPEEDKDNCRWFASCAFLGKRPQFMNPYDTFTNDFQTDTQHKSYSGNNDGTPNDRLNQFPQVSTNVKSQLLKCIRVISMSLYLEHHETARKVVEKEMSIYVCENVLVSTIAIGNIEIAGSNLHTNNPRNLFTTGYGYILDILSDEFGIILGCFKRNVFQTILFHRKSAFLFKVPLARAKLSEIFVEGDRMKFIAVGAPTNFYTDWIAIQVSVSSSLHRADTSVPF